MTDYRAFRDNDVMVSLDEWEIKGAVYIARCMWEKSHADGRQDKHGWEGWNRDRDGIPQGLRSQMIGAVAERAVGKALDIYWPSAVDIGAAADFERHNIEARLIGVDWYGLRVKPDEDPTKRVVGCVIPEGKEREPYRCPGWIVAGDAKRPEWLITPHERAHVYAVPQRELRPLRELKLMLLNEEAERWGFVPTPAP